MTIENNEKFEQHAQTYIEQKVARDQAQGKMDFAKEHMIKYMLESDESVIRIPHDNDTDIKITLSIGSASKLDKEAIAELLDVDEKVVKKDFLLKSVDERKLTFDEYKNNHINEQSERLSVRLAKVEGE